MISPNKSREKDKTQLIFISFSLFSVKNPTRPPVATMSRIFWWAYWVCLVFFFFEFLFRALFMCFIIHDTRLCARDLKSIEDTSQTLHRLRRDGSSLKFIPILFFHFFVFNKRLQRDRQKCPHKVHFHFIRHALYAIFFF